MSLINNTKKTTIIMKVINPYVDFLNYTYDVKIIPVTLLSKLSNYNVKNIYINILVI